MKTALDLLVELYAWKLMKNDLLWGVRTMSRTSDNYSKTAIDYSEKEFFKEEAESFIKPVFMALNNPEYELNNIYQRKLLEILQNAKTAKIIDKNYTILNPKQFTNNVLKKCVLPAYVALIDKRFPLDTNWLFYSLTGVNFASIIQEQIKSVFDNPTYSRYTKPYQDGIISDPDRLHNAILKCGYPNFATPDEINAAVGTDGMDLFQTMVSRMFERVKKS